MPLGITQKEIDEFGAKLYKYNRRISRKVNRAFLPKDKTERLTLVESDECYDPTGANLRQKAPSSKNSSLARSSSSSVLISSPASNESVPIKKSSSLWNLVQGKKY